MLYKKCFLLNYRWQSDPLCAGPFPKTFAEVKRTIENYSKTKYGKSPKSAEEILQEFQRPQVLADLGTSRQREHGRFFNEIHISEKFTNCFFSSSKIISLILNNVKEEDRFFLMDGTFRITPNGIFQQVLIIHSQFGTKVTHFTFHFTKVES